MASNTYYTNVNYNLLNLIPRNADRILEVGCAAGTLGAGYKEINPNCVYMGIELDEKVAGQAITKLDKVFVGNVESLDLCDLPISENSLDCLVYGDVLEHLISPWQELKKRTKLVKEGGMVLACIPNIQHWSIIYNLLSGVWDYQDAGLLDRTHLRFFTLKGVAELFQQAGLEILQIKGVPVQNDFSSFLIGIMKPVLDQLKIDPERFAEQTIALQYLVQARKRMGA